MNRKKIFIQAVICLGIFTLVRGSSLIDNDKITFFCENTSEKLSRNYTLDEIKKIGADTIEAAFEMPVTISKAILTVNQIGQYGTPIDENSDQEKKTVHSVAGGRVLRSGLSSDLGMYVTVEHADQISTYGNLCNLTVVAGDRVKKGDIIGSYDSLCGKDFYYDLEKI